MKSPVLRLGLLTLGLAGLLCAQAPTIGAVVDAASFGAKLAPGSLATVFGTSLDPKAAVTVGGKTAPVLPGGSATQLAIQIPVDAPVGSPIAAISGTASFQITLLPFAPVLFTSDASGKGTVRALHPNLSNVSAASPASPGETISIFGIGLGPTNPPVATGAAPASPASTVVPATVSIGGLPAPVSFAGLIPGGPGLYQINVKVPNAPSGPQTIVLSIGEASSAATGVTLPIAAATGPVIQSGPDSVESAGNYFPLGAPGSGIPQGAYFVVRGTGLGPAAIVLATPPFTTTVGGANGTSITVTPSGGAPVKAFMYYAIDGQVAGILPSNTPVGPATVTVTYNGATSAPAKTNVIRAAFGMYTLNQGGTGPALIQNVSSDGSKYTVNTFTNAANPGQFMVLYGTGLGPVTTSDSDAPGQVTPAGISVQVMVGSKMITAGYAGRQGQYPGLDQIVFQVPSDSSVPDSCFVPLAVLTTDSTTGKSVWSNYGTIAKATGSTTCPAPLGLSASALAQLDQGQKLTEGVITLSRFTTRITVPGLGTLDSTSERAGASFTTLDSSGLFALAQTPGAAPAFTPIGTCIVQIADASSGTPTSTLPPAAKQLNAGTPLALSGPNGKSASLPFNSAAGYSALLFTSNPLNPGAPGVIEAGQWTMQGTGGPDIGAFTAGIAVPAPLNCTNCDSIGAIDRTQPLTVTWTGGGGSQDSVQIGGLSTAPSTADPTKNIAVVFSCSARASDQTFTVPVGVLSQMPPSSADPNAANNGVLILVNVLGGSNTFTAPLTAGGNLDLGFFSYSSLFFKLVGYN